MPKIKREYIRANLNNDTIGSHVDIYVNSDGMFYATLDEETVDKLVASGIKLENNYKTHKKGYFITSTKEDLEQEIHDVLRESLSRELIDTKIVLRYAFFSKTFFAITKKGVIVPNGAWDLDGEILEQKSGTYDSYASQNLPVIIAMYIKPSEKKIYKYLSGKTVCEYDDYSCMGNTQVLDVNYYLKWLEQITSHGQPRGSELMEIDYTEERAKFFVDAYVAMSKIAYGVSKLTDTDNLLALIEKGDRLISE